MKQQQFDDLQEKMFGVNERAPVSEMAREVWQRFLQRVQNQTLYSKQGRDFNRDWVPPGLDPDPNHWEKNWD